MKTSLKQYLGIVIISVITISNVVADGYKVLFIGNSYTQANNLPEVIKNLAASNNDTLSYTANTPGGCTFSQHLQNQSANYIQQGGWDYIVLQEQSQYPSFPDNQFYSQSYPYAQQLCQMSEQYNPDAKVVFYMTWGRKNGDSQNCPIFPPLCTYEGMDSLLYLRYMIMAEDNEAWVSPVGALWHYLRDNHPEIELYSSDESHPSNAGTYAAACAFYTILFGKNPASLSYNYNIGEQVAEKIRKSAKLVVYDSLSKWKFETPTQITYVTENDNIYIWPNPATDVVYIKGVEQIENVQVFTSDGKMVLQAQLSSLIEDKLNISTLPSGLYFLQIADNKKNRKIYKIIKQ